MFHSESAAIDVIQIDVNWPRFVEPHVIDLVDHLPADVLEPHIDAIAQKNLVDGKLVAVP